MNSRTVARLALPLVVAAGLGLACMPAATGSIVCPFSPSPAFATTTSQYANGVYFAEGKGIGGKVPVTVTIKDGKISDVTVGDNSETQGIGSKAIEQLPELIVEANGTDGVDAVSGASVTSKAIFTAVNDCLEQAGTADVKPETKLKTDSDSAHSSSSTSTLGDNSDHLGTLHFGELSVTIPDGYECTNYNAGSDSTMDFIRAQYASESSYTVLAILYVSSKGLAATIDSVDDAEKAVETLMQLPLAEVTSNWQPLDNYEITAQGDSFFGAYSVQCKDIGEAVIVIGAAFDSENNLLLVEGLPFSKEGMSDAVDTARGISGATLPGSSSESFTNWRSSSSTSSSHTPTRGEQNALNRANDYLKFMSFSRSGLIDQLEYEGFSTSEAEYGVDHCGADWNEQAILKAEGYLSRKSFSRSGLIDQLEYEGFTYSQASAAATAAGL